MLRRVPAIAADCHRRASEARRQAIHANDPDTQASWFACEERWLKFAAHQEGCDRLNTFMVNQSAVSAYTVREVIEGSWEWAVFGGGSRILGTGAAESMLDARVAAFAFIAELDKPGPSH